LSSVVAACEKDLDVVTARRVFAGETAPLLDEVPAE
jgi:hypothetical protein